MCSGGGGAAAAAHTSVNLRARQLCWACSITKIKLTRPATVLICWLVLSMVNLEGLSSPEVMVNTIVLKRADGSGAATAVSESVHENVPITSTGIINMRLSTYLNSHIFGCTTITWLDQHQHLDNLHLISPQFDLDLLPPCIFFLKWSSANCFCGDLILRYHHIQKCFSCA